VDGFGNAKKYQKGFVFPFTLSVLRSSFSCRKMTLFRFNKRGHRKDPSGHESCNAFRNEFLHGL
jgi:hypothetical protein